MSRKIIAIGSMLGILSVILGAFGAHGLKSVLSSEQLISFETGVRYQMYHALFLLLIGFTNFLNERTKNTITYLTLIGVLLFSGSIYLLSTREVLGIDIRAIAFVTPIGGLILISSWIVLLVNCMRKNHKID